MPFELINLQVKSNPEDCFYIFDSNILLPQLGLPDDYNYGQFLSFLGKVVKRAEQGNNKPQILTTELQLSEVFNKLLRYQAKIDWDQNKHLNLDFNTYYKDHFRKNGKLKNAFNNIKSDFEAIENAFTIAKPESIKTFAELTVFDPEKLDLNDYHMLLTAKEFDATLITNDKDFYGEDVRMGTYNSSMIQRYKMDVVLAAQAEKLKKK